MLSIKKLYWVVALLFLQNFTFAQNGCGTTEHIESLGAQYRMSLNKLDSVIAARKGYRKKAGGVVTIPVVFHIFHTGETVGVGSNVSQTIIDESVTLLNDAFRASNIYSSTSTDIEIEFALAVRDPNDQPTTGVNRLDASNVPGYEVNGYYDLNEDQIKGMIEWDTKYYLNIWVINNFHDRDIAGFATLPSFNYIPDNRTDDGITIQYDYINTIALPHEAGHYLGLYHTFDGSVITDCPLNGDCSLDGDKVCDTDPHYKNADCGELASSSLNYCTGNTYGNILNNFMAYGSYSCKNVFTQGQAERMNLALEVSYRKFLLESKGLIPPTKPTAQFSVSSSALCLGDVAFTDESLDGPTTWEWTFVGGDPVTSDQQYPVVRYATAGTYSATLKVTNTLGNDQITNTDLFTVYQSVAEANCQPITENPDNNYSLGIEKVEFKDVVYESGLTKSDHFNLVTGAYLDNACTHIAKVELGEIMILKVTVGTFNKERLNVYIDWNNDGEFNETDEQITSLYGVKGEQTIEVTVPSQSNYLGQVIRVRIMDAFYGNSITSCKSPEEGQVEDYGLVINFPTDCNNVVNGTAAVDDCNVCSGGTTGKVANATCTDCNNVVNGTAAVDDCNVCSGGTTNIIVDDCDVTGLLDVDDMNFTIYPNPSTGIFQFKAVNMPHTIYVINTLGQTIEKITSPNEILDLSHLDKGMYYINMIWENENRTQSVMISK